MAFVEVCNQQNQNHQNMISMFSFEWAKIQMNAGLVADIHFLLCLLLCLLLCGMTIG